MKLRHITYTLLLLAAALTTACSSDDALQTESIISGSMTGGPAVKNDFDRWLEQNFQLPYNIRFKYRYEDIESDFGYYTVPADYEKAIEMAHIVKYICIDSYTEVAGADFTRQTFPKEFYCIGEWEYKNNGTMVLATAAGGRKILLAGVNHLDEFKRDIAQLTSYYLKTVHHEFTHILNQTKEMPTAYKFITGTSYVSSAWSDFPFDMGYLARGYITAYAQDEDGEDFAEMLSHYVCYSAEQWEEWMNVENYFGVKTDDAGRTEVCIGTSQDRNPIQFELGKIVSYNSDNYELTRVAKTDREAIDAKLLLLRQYMEQKWNIDIDVLRETILRREAELAAGKYDLDDLTIK